MAFILGSIIFDHICWHPLWSYYVYTPHFHQKLPFTKSIHLPPHTKDQSSSTPTPPKKGIGFQIKHKNILMYFLFLLNISIFFIHIEPVRQLDKLMGLGGKFIKDHSTIFCILEQLFTMYYNSYDNFNLK